MSLFLCVCYVCVYRFVLYSLFSKNMKFMSTYLRRYFTHTHARAHTHIHTHTRTHTHIYIYIYRHHHHYIKAQSSLTHSCHPSRSTLALVELIVSIMGQSRADVYRHFFSVRPTHSLVSKSIRK